MVCGAAARNRSGGHGAGGQSHPNRTNLCSRHLPSRTMHGQDTRDDGYGETTETENGLRGVRFGRSGAVWLGRVERRCAGMADRCGIRPGLLPTLPNARPDRGAVASRVVPRAPGRPWDWSRDLRLRAAGFERRRIAPEKSHASSHPPRFHLAGSGAGRNPSRRRSLIDCGHAERASRVEIARPGGDPPVPSPRRRARFPNQYMEATR